MAIREHKRPGDGGGCEGAFPIRAAADCTAALESIADGYRVEPTALRAWLAAVEAASVRGFLEPDVESVEGIDTDEAAVAMAEALAAFVARRWSGVGGSPVAHAEAKA